MPTRPDFFDKLFVLPNELTPTMQEVLDFAEAFVTVDHTGKHLSWPAITQAVSEYPGSDMSFVKDVYNGATTRDSLSNVVKKISKIPGEVLGDALNKTNVYQKLLDIFTDLRSAESTYFADFSASSENLRPAGWEYRIVFSVPICGDATSFYSLITTITLSADTRDKAWWYGITSDTVANFSVTIKGLELRVQRGFEDPVCSKAAF